MNEFDPYQQWLGIPPHEQPPDYYRLLGLRRFESDPSVIQLATDQRMVLVRTYQTGPRARFTQKLLNELASAKLCLLNPFSKAEYDASLPDTPSGTGNIADSLLPAAVAGDGIADSAYPASTLPVISRNANAGNKSKHSGSLPGVGIWVALIVVLVVWGTIYFQVGQSPSTNSAPEENDRVNAPTVSKDDKIQAATDPTMVAQNGSGVVAFPMSSASQSGKVSVEPRDNDDYLVGFQSKKDAATWKFKLAKLPSQGIFRVRIAYQATEAASGAEYVLEVDGEGLSHDVRTLEGMMEDEFYLPIKRSGEHTLRFFVHNVPAEATFALRSIEFTTPVVER